MPKNKGGASAPAGVSEFRTTLVPAFLDHGFLDCSAPHQNGEIINRCNHFGFEEDDQFEEFSTAASRLKYRRSFEGSFGTETERNLDTPSLPPYPPENRHVKLKKSCMSTEKMTYAGRFDTFSAFRLGVAMRRQGSVLRNPGSLTPFCSSRW